MSLLDRIFNRAPAKPPAGSYAALNPRATKAWQDVQSALRREVPSSDLTMLKAVLERQVKAPSVSLGIPDVGFKGVRQQLFQRFNLVDLYAIAHNNSVVKTATGHLKQEVFRRGLRWEPAFGYRNRETGENFTMEDILKVREGEPERYVELLPLLDKPDPLQRVRFEQLMQRINIYGQSLMEILHTLEDDLNIADDAFLFLSADYYMGWQHGQKEIIRRQVKQVYRLDPVFVEYDTDQENRPGFAHHVCLNHREELLTIPPDEDWQTDWKGRCPRDGHTTFPVIYRYSPYKGTFGVRSGMQGPDQQSMYLVEGEVIHASKFSPSELYGYSPVLSIYEKALSLIGMDRYLYDYFFERQIPQGVITTVTDNPEDLEVRKEQMLAQALNNPHYIPWLAVSSKTGQGQTEFVRFAYSLDELEFLPVQEHIERTVASLYGVPGLFMGFEDGVGGLNNESQQMTRMSRGAKISQTVYNTNVFPLLLEAFGITDWFLILEDAEELSEQFEIELKTKKAQWANTLVTMGFGVRYKQDTDEYEIYGDVKPRAEQEAEQAALYQDPSAGMGGDPMMGGGAPVDGSFGTDASDFAGDTFTEGMGDVFDDRIKGIEESLGIDVPEEE